MGVSIFMFHLPLYDPPTEQLAALADAVLGFIA